MNKIKKLMPLLFTLLIVFMLGACGSGLEKPTGLEDNDKQSTTQVDNEIDDTSNNEAFENEEEKSNDKSKSKKEVAQKGKKKSDDKEVDEKNSKVEKKSKTSKSSDSKVKENQSTQTKSESKSESKSNQQAQDKTKDNSQKSASKTKSDSKPDAQKQKKSEKKSSQSKTESKPKPKPKPASKPKPKPKPEPKKAAVTQSIVISSSEVPLSNAKTEIKDGDTILDALIKVTRDKGIQMDYRGGQKDSAYVEGIANVYEFDRGQGSGWMIRINGVFPNRGVGTIPVYDGDNIEWLYTTDLGKDLGANLQPFR